VKIFFMGPPTCSFTSVVTCASVRQNSEPLLTAMLCRAMPSWWTNTHTLTLPKVEKDMRTPWCGDVPSTNIACCQSQETTSKDLSLSLSRERCGGPRLSAELNCLPSRSAPLLILRRETPQCHQSRQDHLGQACMLASLQ